jgi:hypothetical protein
MSISKQKINSKPKENIKKVSLKIEDTLLDEIQKEAEHKMEGVDTLVNQILRSHLKWHKLAKKARLAYISKDLMAKTIDHLTDEQVTEMTKTFFKNHFVGIIHMISEENTFSSFMNALCLWFEESGFNYRIEMNNDMDIYKIYFDMGRKWSLFFKTRMDLVFEHFKVKDSEVQMTDNTVILKIKRE